MSKAPEKTPEEKRKEEIKKILAENNKEFKSLDNKSDYGENDFSKGTKSREYKRFMIEEKRFEKYTIYEKLCREFERFNLEPDKDMRERMQQAIDFAHLKITPGGALSFAVFSGLFFVLMALFVAFVEIVFLGGVDLTHILMIFLFSMFSIVGFIKYPEFLADNFRIKASQEIVLAIIYMIIYMRTSPQLEGGVRFAAKNLSGPLAYDLRKLLWDVDTRKYETIYDAMTDYLNKWKSNKEFIDSIELIRTSLEQSETRRNQMLDEAINVILQGTQEKMRKYSQSLRTPITIIYALGITLPVLVLVMFPIILLMLNEEIKPIFLVVGYDVFLPILIYIVSYEVLRRRPIGYSTPDASLHPKYTPIGKFKMTLFGKEKILPFWPIGLSVSLPFLALGVFLMFIDETGLGFLNLSGSLCVIFGIGIGFSTSFLLESKNKIGIRNQVKKIQDEFSQILFQLGNRLSLGNPFESAMKQTAEKSPHLGITKLFKETIKNIEKNNMSLESALFDREVGSVWDYPSKLVINVIRIVFEATKKGVRNAALSAIAISRYVKQIHDIEEELNNMLSESTSSMRVLGMFIAPLIAGVTVTMTAVMMLIFNTLGGLLEGIDMSSASSGTMGFESIMMGGWGNIGALMSIGTFQMVVGIYVIEISYLLAYLVSGIDNGENDIVSRRELAGWNILIGMMVYIFTVFITYFIFTPMVSVLLT